VRTFHRLTLETASGHGVPMSFTNEVDKLNRLRKSDLITEIEFQQSKKRLLEECVGRIEAWHERKATEFALEGPVEVAAVPVERQVPNAAAVPVERQVPNTAAGKIRLPIRGDHAQQTIPLKVHVRPVEAGSTFRAEELKDRHPEEVNERHLEEVNERHLEDCVRRIETFYDRNPTYRERWGLPRVQLVRGVVRNVRLSPREETGDYTASLDIDGRQMEISSSSAVRIAVGDRVTLGGYERDGRLLILGHRNESDGSHSDLSHLRTRYRVLLAIGRVSLFAGLIAIAGMLMLLIHMPPAVSNFASWRFTPYVLFGLAAAAACYLGLTLSFLGSWARDFHDAMTPRRLPGLAA